MNFSDSFHLFLNNIPMTDEASLKGKNWMEMTDRMIFFKSYKYMNFLSFFWNIWKILIYTKLWDNGFICICIYINLIPPVKISNTDFLEISNNFLLLWEGKKNKREKASFGGPPVSKCAVEDALNYWTQSWKTILNFTNKLLWSNLYPIIVLKTESINWIGSMPSVTALLTDPQFFVIGSTWTDPFHQKVSA